MIHIYNKTESGFHNFGKFWEEIKKRAKEFFPKTNMGATDFSEQKKGAKTFSSKKIRRAKTFFLLKKGARTFL